MDNDLFIRSAALFKKWGDTRLSSGATLSEKLTLGKVSLWEVATPFLALYRFPEFILKTDSGLPARKRVTEVVRPYRGRLGRLREDFFYHMRRNLTDCRRWPQTSSCVLFLGFWPLFYRETFRAAAEYLADKKAVSTVALFGGKRFLENPSRSLIHFHSTWQHVTPSVVDRAKEYQSCIRRMEKELLPDLREMMEAELPAGWSVLKRELKWLFWSLFPCLARETAIAEHIINEHCPAIIVSPDDSDRARIYTILARAVGIPTLVVQQGVVNKKAVEWRFCTADRVAAIGPSSMEQLCAHGVAAGKIELTGCPRFDVLCRSSAEERDKIRSAMGISADKKMVLLASQPDVYGAFSSTEARCNMLREMGKVAASIKSLHLVVKAHPTEDVRDLERLIGNRGRGQLSFVECSCDIQSLIMACDVFVTFFSTSALQALIAAKPVISLCFHGSGVSGPYVNSKAVFAARSADELAEHLNVLTGPDRDRVLTECENARKKMVYDLTYLADGCSAQRVAELIMRMGRNVK